MTQKDISGLAVQNVLSRLAAIFFIPVCSLIIRLMGYRFRDLRAFRKRCRDHFRNHDGGWLICANHLTLVDSAFIAFAVLPYWRSILHYHWFPWNLPERRNFNRNPFDTALCYLMKCIPITRGGDREEIKRTLEKCDHLLSTGHSILVFPEGGRSRTGRIDVENYSYGVGRFVKNLDRMKIMCIYFRGDRQETYSSIPRPGDTFTMAVEVFEPERLEYNGLKAQRDYAGQIIRQLSRMEERHFESRERYCRLDGSRQQGEESGFPVPQQGVHTR
ncbi:MAG TPA: lysophospholipid acyltransferase family protein [Syntrophales bacterium]|nr:lysophospholipid acyltransferase family protein [Syntrophales bacterium]